MSSESYGKYLSEVYDTLNSDIDCCAWADFYEQCFKKFGVNVHHINEIACGTGTMSRILSKRGYTLTCSDLSEEMLSLADKRAQEENIKNVIYTRQDMRSFCDSKKADAVICMLDSLNCMPAPKDVKMCFASAFNVLREGGIFLFDVNSKYKFEKIYGDNAYILEDEGVVCAWQNFYDESKKICDFYLSFFLQEQNGLYSRHDEVNRERMYTVKALTKYLCLSGFEVAGVYGDFDFQEADENTHERLYFAAIKR